MQGTVGSRDSQGRKMPALIAGLISALLVSLAAASTASAGQPVGFNPDDLPVASCFWTGAFSADNEKTNLAYPGTEVTYWGAKFNAPAGSTLTLKGRYPHARYSSFNAYVKNGTSSSSLHDSQIKPDRNSTNPALPGGNRNTKHRSYTIKVVSGALPSSPAANTLYAAPDPTPDSYQDILYRVYVPDKGRNRSGGTGLPTPSLKLPGGKVIKGQSLCNQINSIHYYTAGRLPSSTYNALVNWPGKDPATNPALSSFSFIKFFNLGLALARYKTQPEQDAAWAANPVETGTQYNNGDARYMTGAYSFDYGEVLAIRGKLPTTPLTWQGNRKMTRAQMVEWDICGIESLVTTKTYRCLFDQQIPLSKRHRRYVIAFAHAGKRPGNARARCGVAWLPADPQGDGAGRPDAGLLLTRNVLPSAGFKRSIWNVSSPYDAGEVMGDYYPKGTYMSTRDFESHGCPYRPVG